MMLTSSLRGLWSAPGFVLAGLLASAPAFATPQSTTPPPSQPASAWQPTPGARFQQSVREQQVRDQLQQNQLQEQLRQGTMDAIRRPSASSVGQARQLDQADRAQRAQYQAQQRALLDRYESAATPPAVKPVRPASARSGG